MLVLSRKLNESVCIADEIEVVIVEVRGKRVRLGFRAPASVSIQRMECKTVPVRSSHPDLHDAFPRLAASSSAGK